MYFHTPIFCFIISYRSNNRLILSNRTFNRQSHFPNWGVNERGIVLLGRGLYVEYGEGFTAGSLILLLAMIGVVELVGDLI